VTAGVQSASAVKLLDGDGVGEGSDPDRHAEAERIIATAVAA